MTMRLEVTMSIVEHAVLMIEVTVVDDSNND